MWRINWILTWMIRAIDHFDWNSSELIIAWTTFVRIWLLCHCHLHDAQLERNFIEIIAVEVQNNYELTINKIIPKIAKNFIVENGLFGWKSLSNEVIWVNWWNQNDSTSFYMNSTNSIPLIWFVTDAWRSMLTASTISMECYAMNAQLTVQNV